MLEEVKMRLKTLEMADQTTTLIRKYEGRIALKEQSAGMLQNVPLKLAAGMLKQTQ
jgi:hypothetical protein